jgi:hypothetical protein
VIHVRSVHLRSRQNLKLAGVLGQGIGKSSWLGDHKDGNVGRGVLLLYWKG